MKSQSNPNHSSFRSTYLNSTWRLALITPLVFGVAAVLGYTATATAPTLLKKIVSNRAVHAPITDPVPVHPVGHLLRVANVFDQPVVYTDKRNYQPGETALIFGSGFWPNELITLQVVHVDDTAEPGEGHEPWNVMADEFGNFTSTWFVNPDDSAGSMFRLTAFGNTSSLAAEFVFTDGSANLDTCANGPTSAPVQCTGESWDNGNLNASKSHYAEGDSVPYRTVFENLVVGHTYTISIEYDTTQGGKHAFDYLTSFDRTEPSPGNNPCTQKQGGSIVTLCNSGTFVTTPIPVDPNVAAGQDQIPSNGDDITQIPGVFTLYNGNALSIVNPGAPYTLSGSYAGNSSTEITVQFNATAATAVLAWSGHISTRLNWGLANSAIAISGSPYHMRLTNITCSDAGEQCNVGQQDHQLAAGAVFFPVQLTIIKETNPDDAQTKQFNYTATGSNLGPFSLTPPNGTTPAQQIFNLTDTTARTVTESDPHATAPEFNLTNLSCTQTDGGLGVGSLTTNLGTRTVSFTPNEGQFISCTFTNTEDFTATRGKIIVDKVTNPSGDPTSFDFTTTYEDPFSLTDAATPNDSGQKLMPGTYQVSEAANSNYVTTATCTSSKGDPADDPSSIHLSAGEVVTCTFTNTKRGKIIVEKQTNPDGAAGSFTFTGDAAGSISDGGQIVVNNLAPGTYTSIESDPTPGFDLTSISCDDGASTTPSTSSVGTRTATFKLDPGETVKCTFTNTKRGKIIVEKQTNPDGAVGSFTFTGDAAGSISDGGQIVVNNVSAGTYTSTESDPTPGFDLTSISCDDGASATPSTTNLGTRTATFKVDPGETVKCTFTNTKRGTIIVEKQTNPDGAAGSFAFTGDAAGSISDGGQITVNNVAPGTYSSTESDPTPGFDLTNISCDDGGSPTPSLTNLGTRTATFKVDPGETVKCTFTNTKRGKIIVEKQTNPDGAAGSFAFTGDAAGSIPDGGQITVNNVVPGTYSSTESDPTPGFDLTNISCDDGASATPSLTSLGTRTATFKVDPGETVKCTFTNTKRGTIIVEKQTNPDGAAGSFAFTGDAAGSISDGQQITVNNVVPGTYSSTESNPTPGFDLTNISCDDGGSATPSLTNLGTRTATFKVDPGETVKCTFTNTKRGTIIVEKQTNPDGAAGSFAFTGDAAGSISDGQQITVNNVAPGTYSSTESDPTPGFDLTNISCDDGASATPSLTNLGTRTATFKVDPGETVKCTFTNTKRGKIIVEKQTSPDGAAGSFAFTGDAAGSISDGGQITVNNVAPGTYTSTETDPTPGFDLTNISCDDGASSTPSTTDLGTRTATFKVDPGETVKCTFTNTKRGKIIVEKQTNPDGAAGSFAFTGDAAGSVSDGGQIVVNNVAPGTYTSTETDPTPGFDLTSISCDDGASATPSTTNLGTRTATFKVDPGETVKCTFTNRKRGTIIVEKQTNPDGAAGSFAFTGTAAGSISDGGQIVVNNVAPGTYTSTESDPTPGFDLTSIVCDDGASATPSTTNLGTRTAYFKVDAGETVKCTFTNTKRANLIVEKQTNPDGASGSFTFTGTAAGTIGDGGTIPVNNLVPGTYTSTENDPTPNFDLTSISCNDANSTGNVGSRTATFRLEPGETVKCTFTNTQRGMAKVVKTVSGGPPPAGQSFTFELRQGASTVSDGTTLESKNTDASGNINFTTKLVAGQTYQICEWVFPGWNTNLAGDGPLFVPNSIIPPALPNPNVINLTVCADFTVQPGQTRTFNVENSPPPGGRALTIGFWKNWASCSSSNGKGQKPMLDLALGIASAMTTNPPGGLVVSAQNPGSLWPNYAATWYLVAKGNPLSTPTNIRPAPDCSIAENLLDKSTIDGKKKMSSDPLFNMTAQLVGAQLNRFMGAGVNGSVIMDIDRAVLLNGKYKFNGITYTPKLTTADANTANCLATQLDNYNNGRSVSLCP